MQKETGEGLLALRGHGMPLFLFKHLNKVDQKGRVSVPAVFRSALRKSDFEGVVVAPSVKAPCLDCYAYERMEELCGNIDESFGSYTDESDTVAGEIFGEAAPLQFDPNGRIMLPKEFLDYAGIDKEAKFVGLGRKFQIWEASRHKAHKVGSREQAAKDLLKIRPNSSSVEGRS